MPNFLALDIGGANIKVADGHGYAVSYPFALWKAPEKLVEQLAEILAVAPPAERIVVTMTGELCDCFSTKREGVQSIVAATLTAACDTPVHFYQTTGQFVAADEACKKHLLTAASNWHALATFATKYCEGESAILIDIGSTTTDIIPIESGQEIAHGRTDMERLQSGELIYTGVVRSPACAIVSHLSWRGSQYPVAQEFFATSGDAYLLLGNLAEDEKDTDTADGKPFTVQAALTRLARLICGDRDLISREEVEAFAIQIRDAQLTILEPRLVRVIDSLPGMPEFVVLSGQGEFLAHQAADRVRFSGKRVSLNERLGPAASRCATAHALAVLAQEQL
jgi:probable H4MPT-linked C1 transfer pathway protein